MMHAQPRPKLGMIVENDVYKRIAEPLVLKIAARLHLPAPPKLGTIRLGASPAICEMNEFVESLVEKGYTPVIAVVGTETTDEREAAALAGHVDFTLIPQRLHLHTRLVPVVPCIESWVLADEVAVQQVAGRPRPGPFDHSGLTEPEVLQMVLKKWFGAWGSLQKTVDQVARLLEPDRIRPRSPSFARFERLVREILLAQVAPAQGAETQHPTSM